MKTYKLDDIDNPISICEDFAKRHDILMNDLIQSEISGIYWTIRGKLEVDSALNSRSGALLNEPTWGILLSMLDRVFEHVEGSFGSFVTGSPASAEVIARTAVESSLNVMYILNGDPANRSNRIIQYLSYFIEHERHELKNWENLTKNLDDKVATAHYKSINHKKQGLNFYEEVVHRYKNEAGAKNNIGFFPYSIADRFRLLGLEMDYRTVYAAMCSQTHNDAEDLLNYYICRSSGNKELLMTMGIETVNFSRLLMYFGLSYYLEATHRYATCFNLNNAIPILTKGKDAISEKLKEIGLELGMDKIQS